MAARDRFGGFSEHASTPLQRYILNACDPQNFEPNLALNLEITDLINQKKGNAPREAAVSIVHFVNHRNQNVALLALNLLDICVKNCGYPFHLQVSTKEFLNELVRRFPERPPVHASRAQGRILELIEEWRQTICETSRYKEDLGFVRDMHRLLSYKGYHFPSINKEDAAVLNPSDNLRSAEEMEEEERSAQSAKLQELIRRGTPRDLQEANKLMKVMAGFDTKNKTDYRAKAAEEVSRVQQKAKLLEDMLQRYKAGDEIKEGDVFEELANALSSAHPKIQKMCEEESEDHEAVAKLFEINDSINRTIERYRLIKQGDIEGAAKIPRGTLGTSGAGVTKGPDNELSLIDLGGPDDAAAPAATADSGLPAASSSQPAGNALENDLLGLSLDDSSYGLGGNITLGATPVAQQTPEQQSAAKTSIMNAFNQSALSPQPTGSQNLNIFDSLHASASASQPTSPPPPSQAQRAADPFASLSTSSSTPRQASPFQFQKSVNTAPSPPAGLVDVGPSAPFKPPQTTQPQPRTQQQSNGDDEWTFASALPDQPADFTVVNSSILVVFTASRQDDGVILLQSRMSNNTAQPVTQLEFQLAVMRAYTLKLELQSSRSLAPHQREGITQTIRLLGVERGRGDAVKLRWKVSYNVGAEQRDESGEITSLPVS